MSRTLSGLFLVGAFNKFKRPRKGPIRKIHGEVPRWSKVVHGFLFPKGGRNVRGGEKIYQRTHPPAELSSPLSKLLVW